MFLGQGGWGWGTREHNNMDDTVSCFPIHDISTFHCSTPLHIRHFSLLWLTTNQLSERSSHSSSCFLLLPSIPTFFPSCLSQTVSCFAQGSSLDLKILKQLFLLSSQLIVNASPQLFFHIAVAITLDSFHIRKYYHDDTMKNLNTLKRLSPTALAWQTIITTHF